MDFDQMLETWRAQNTAPPYDVNRDELRQSLQAEEARVRSELRLYRRGLWFAWVVGSGLAVWAGFWIAISITNGWDAIYAIASGLSLCIFAFGAGALWVSRGREPKRNFDNTLEQEVRRNLALVEEQLSIARRWILPLLGSVSIVVGTGLFSWTINKSQDIPNMSSSLGWFWFAVVFLALIAWGSYKDRHKKSDAKSKLELRRQRLRELLAVLSVLG